MARLCRGCVLRAATAWRYSHAACMFFMRKAACAPDVEESWPCVDAWCVCVRCGQLFNPLEVSTEPSTPELNPVLLLIAALLICAW